MNKAERFALRALMLPSMVIRLLLSDVSLRLSLQSLDLLLNPRLFRLHTLQLDPYLFGLTLYVLFR